MGIRIGYCGFPVAQPHYARVFQVVEVQQTFDQVPRITTLARWRERLPNPFESTLKAWQLIPHYDESLSTPFTSDSSGVPDASPFFVEESGRERESSTM